MASRLFAKQANVSYAQTGEDLIIGALLGWPTEGYYVDVGCNHPIRGSNTYKLYLRGMKGVAIDANDAFAPMYRQMRPRDVFVSRCVGEFPGNVEFHIFKNKALSSVAGARAPGLADEQYVLDHIISKPVERLDAILDTCGAPPTFALLSIDVEGQDLSVLRSIDLHRYRPQLIVLEQHDVAKNSPGEGEAAQHLKAQGYELVAQQMSNFFFLRDGRT